MSRLTSEHGQALPLSLGVAGVLVALAFGLLQLGRAHLAAAQAQTAADLAALAAARDAAGRQPALLSPLRRRRIERRAAEVAHGAGATLRSLRLTGGGGPAVEVVVAGRGPLRTIVEARAVAGPAAGSEVSGRFTRRAYGGGYGGPLVERDGRPMCPPVAAAFDRMDQAAGRAGVDLVVTSGFRSDAEQAELFRRRPDPRWVAPPGRSRHRDATELDIAGTSGAWAWLAQNGSRFGFAQRYSWEPWHWGYLAGCAGGSAGAGDEGLARAAAKPNVVLLEDLEIAALRVSAARPVLRRVPPG